MSEALPANAERALYGELPPPGGPTGSICHQRWPAAASCPANRCASGPRSPLPCGPGSDVRWRSTPPLRSSRSNIPSSREWKDRVATCIRVRRSGVQCRLDSGRRPAARPPGSRAGEPAPAHRLRSGGSEEGVQLLPHLVRVPLAERDQLARVLAVEEQVAEQVR